MRVFLRVIKEEDRNLYDRVLKRAKLKYYFSEIVKEKISSIRNFNEEDTCLYCMEVNDSQFFLILNSISRGYLMDKVEELKWEVNYYTEQEKVKSNNNIILFLSEINKLLSSNGGNNFEIILNKIVDKQIELIKKYDNIWLIKDKEKVNIFNEAVKYFGDLDEYAFLTYIAPRDGYMAYNRN